MVTEPRVSFAGVEWGRLSVHGDSRGSFREVWRASTYAGPQIGAMTTLNFVQANVSYSEAGVLRGLHFHKRQFDHWVVLKGAIFVALVDLRLHGVDVVTRTLTENDTVGIPPMVAHGFLALRPTELLYLVTNEYDGTDEHGIAWDDPEVDIAWPTVGTLDGAPILSERDGNNPTLAALRDSAGSAVR